MKYKLLLFDADETLFDFKKTEESALKKLVATFNVEYKEDYCINTYKEINTQIWKEYEEGKISSQVLKIERFSRLIKKLNLNKDAIELSKLYEQYLGDGSFIYNETENLLKYLSENYRIGIITNGLYDVQKRRIKESVIAHYFDEVIISDQIKIAKPDKKIFEHALNKLEHNDKDSVLMIGDSLTSDIKGGINAGVDTCWFNVDSSKENNTLLKPTYEINSLLDLKDIL